MTPAKASRFYGERHL
jgi:hypothetical protein